MACGVVKLVTILILVVGICITRQTNDNDIRFGSKLKEWTINENGYKLQNYLRRRSDYEEYYQDYGEVNYLSIS